LATRSAEYAKKSVSKINRNAFSAICVPKFYFFETFAPFAAKIYWPQEAQSSQKMLLNI